MKVGEWKQFDRQPVGDLCASSWIDENDYLGEHVWVKSPLDDVCHCLPPAKVKIKTKGGVFYTKATTKSDNNSSEPYLLSNRTAELIESSEKSVLMIEAIVTRNAGKIVPFDKEKETVLNAASDFSFESTDPVLPTQEDGTEPTIEFPAFVKKKMKAVPTVKKRRRNIVLSFSHDSVTTACLKTYKVHQAFGSQRARETLGEGTRLEASSI
ncbi:hypothetical protein TNCV_1514591 [Trichonephila clavipes]|nr:hypothetical protein TNCV_1514591 [Trichonephila clavipes]